MSSFNSPDEILDAAVQSMLAEEGAEGPPAAVIGKLRQQIAERSATVTPTRDVPFRLREQVAWWQLAACIVVMVTCGWIVGAHQSLLSHVAGRQISAQGAETLFYTDGRLKELAGDDS